MLDNNDLFRKIIKNKPWPQLNKSKKHVAVDHCPKFKGNHSKFIKKWWGTSGIYKITFLPFRLFTYYGSSVNLGERLKYHYYNTPKQTTLLGLFINTFGWDMFSVTIVELVPSGDLKKREDWYLTNFMPLLNTLISSSTDTRSSNTKSIVTRLKISKALSGMKHKDSTKKLMSQSRSGVKNFWYGKPLAKKILDAAAEKKGIQIFAYDVHNFSLVNGKPFRSVRDTYKNLPISNSKLDKILDKGIAHKGFYYFTKPQLSKPLDK